jgi:hypothetical protein
MVSDQHKAHTRVPSTPPGCLKDSPWVRARYLNQAQAPLTTCRVGGHMSVKVMSLSVS